MNARRKLNVAFLNGSLLLAGAIGIWTGSCLVFAVALVALVLGNVWAGYIDSTPDGIPAIGEVESIPGFIVAAGSVFVVEQVAFERRTRPELYAELDRLTLPWRRTARGPRG